MHPKDRLPERFLGFLQFSMMCLKIQEPISYWIFHICGKSKSLSGNVSKQQTEKAEPISRGSTPIKA